MTDDKKPLDTVLDWLVFAPVGFALEAREMFPKAIERGRQQVTGQVATYKMMGEFAVKQGQVEAKKRLESAREQADGLTENLATQAAAVIGSARQNAEQAADAGRAQAAAAAAASARIARGASDDGAADPPAAQPAAKKTKKAPSVKPGPKSAPPASKLAIPDYESLSASQVVPRLAGLSERELAQVQAYESAHRGRKTILNKIAQIQG